MDSDDLKDAVSRGIATPEQQLHHFLKTETFYVILVILVVVMAGHRLVASFRDAAVVLGLKSEQTSPIASNSGPELLLQSQLQADETSWMEVAGTKDPRAAEFATGVRKLSDLLFWCGWAALLVLVIWWALPGAGRGRADALAPVWSLWDVVKLTALFAIGTQVFHYIFPFDPMRPFEDRGDWIAEIFARILLMGALIHIVVAERGGRLRDLGFRGNFVGNVLIALLVFLAVQPLLHLAGAWVAERFPDATVQETLQAMLNTPSAWVLWLATAMAVLVTPIAEELFFRSFLQPALQQSLGRWMGIVAGATFFAAAHMNPYTLVPLLILGLALGFAYDRTRSLAVPVIVHAAYNGLALLALFADRGLKEAANHAIR